MRVCGLSFDDALLVAGLDAFGDIFALLCHQQQTIVYNTINLFMHVLEISSRSKEVSIVHRTRIVETSRSLRYGEQSQEDSYEPPELAIYQILLSVIRKQTRKPFQLFKQFLLFSDEDQSSIEVNYRHPRFELEIIEENIRSACTLIRQRMLVDGFISIKALFLKKLRVEQAYYNQQNLLTLYSSISTFQTFFMKWQGFGKLYEHFRGQRLMKLNLSKIEAISNDYTSKQLEDYHAFLSQRREVEVINSYLIDRSSQVQSAELHYSPHDRYVARRQQEEIKEHEEQYLQQMNYNRSLRKSRTQYDIKKPERTDQLELDSKVLVTHRKEGEWRESGSTVRVRQEIQQERDTGTGASSQQIYLIRDYRAKGRSTPPSNFIKVPVLSQNVKIVQILTGRKKTHKKRITKEQIQIQREICQNCKFCVQMRERKEMLKVVQRRFETIVIQSHRSSVSTEIVTK